MGISGLQFKRLAFFPPDIRTPSWKFSNLIFFPLSKYDSLLSTMEMEDSSLFSDEFVKVMMNA